MFWRKNSKSNESKEKQLIEAYLSVGMRLIKENLTNSAITSAVQIFILGMAINLGRLGIYHGEDTFQFADHFLLNTTLFR